MRWITCLGVAAALQLPAAVMAQQAVVSGWVESVDNQANTLTIRGTGNPRTIQVAPDAVIRVNGQAARLDQLPRDGQISVMAQKLPSGVLQATEINVRSTATPRSAAYPAGSVVDGQLVRIDIPANQITLRTNSGNFVVSLGSAPITWSGRRVSTRYLQLGQQLRVMRSVPTGGATDYVTQSIYILRPSPTATRTTSTSVRRSSSRATVRRRSTHYASNLSSSKSRSRSMRRSTSSLITP